MSFLSPYDAVLMFFLSSSVSLAGVSVQDLVVVGGGVSRPPPPLAFRGPLVVLGDLWVSGCRARRLCCRRGGKVLVLRRASVHWSCFRAL